MRHTILESEVIEHAMCHPASIVLVQLDKAEFVTWEKCYPKNDDPGIPVRTAFTINGHYFDNLDDALLDHNERVGINQRTGEPSQAER